MERNPDLLDQIHVRLKAMSRAEVIDFSNHHGLAWQTVQKLRLRPGYDAHYSTVARIARGLKLPRRF